MYLFANVFNRSKMFSFSSLNFNFVYFYRIDVIIVS